MRAEPLRTELAAPPADDAGEPHLVELISAEIDQSGPITFARFMERALYEPGLGYYATSRERTTRSGDFLTAPELHPIFGQVVACQIGEMCERLGNPARFTVREYGAGRRTLGQALTADTAYEPVEFASAKPVTPLTGVVLANEFLDALPIHRLVYEGGAEPSELLVGWRDGQFVEEVGEISDDRLIAWLERHRIGLHAGDIVEVNLQMADWLKQIGRDLERGFVLILDYGSGDRDTVRAFRGQHVSSAVLGGVGHQDLTADVDFDALEDEARDAGFEVLGRVRQAEFLLNAGLDEVYAAARETADQDWDSALNLRAAVRRLLDSSGLGGFVVVILGKNVEREPPLSGLVKRAV
ncbi:MAG: SAM-dependent methyltransferase [Chloroflexota bacterium]